MVLISRPVMSEIVIFTSLGRGVFQPVADRGSLRRVLAARKFF